MDIGEIGRWVASISGIIAALMVASNRGTKVTGYGFVLFTLSSILWIVLSLTSDQEPLAAQNVVLFAINLWGIYQYLIRSGPKDDA